MRLANLNSNPILPYMALAPVFSVFLYFVTVEFGMEVYAGSCILSCLVSLLFFRDRIHWNHYKTILGLYFLFGICSLLFYQNPFGSTELRTIFYTSLFVMTCPKFLINRLPLKIILIASNLLLFVPSAYQVFFLDVTRVGGVINPIPYANICASTSLMLFVFFLFEKKPKLQLIEGITFILSLMTIIFSGSRGVWLSFIIGWFFIIIICFDQIKQTFSKKTQLLFISALIAILFIASPLALKHIGRIKTDIKRIEQNKYTKSAGVRLQLWKAAVYTIKEDGIWGPKRSFEQNLEYLVEKGVYPEQLLNKRRYHHYHNTYLDKMARYGILGLVTWLLLALFPIFSFFKMRKHSNHLFYLTLAPTMIYMISSLTNMPFRNQYSLSFYIAVTYTLYLLGKNGSKHIA